MNVVQSSLSFHCLSSLPQSRKRYRGQPHGICVCVCLCVLSVLKDGVMLHHLSEDSWWPTSEGQGGGGGGCNANIKSV